jgi:hypothetical protein
MPVVSAPVQGESVRSDSGSVLILALVYLVAISLIVGALASWALNDLHNTSGFATAETLRNAASNATEVAIQDIRYVPLLGAGETINGNNPPSYCWGSGPVSKLTTNYETVSVPASVAMAVWCSTVWNPTSQTSRIVTFSTCLSTVTAAACGQTPFLKAVVDFDDYPAGVSSAPIQGPCSVWCGQALTVVSWTWGSSANTSVSGIATSLSFSTEPSNTTVGAVTSAAVTVLDAASNPVVGDPVTVLLNNGSFDPNSTVTATTNTSGVASFTNLILDTVGTGRYTMKAVDGTVSANSTSFTVGKGANSITLTSTVPASASVGGATYTPTATATSGDAVAIKVDSSASAVCSISAGVVSFTAAGTCTLDFNDAASANYVAASQAQQAFTVGKGANSITLTSTVPASASVGGATYTPTATATSGDAVAIKVDSSASAVCSISAGVVSFTAAGTCTLDFNDAASANYVAANQVQQAFTVGKGAKVVTNAANNQSNNGGSITSGQFTADPGSTVLILVTYEDPASQTCSSASASGTAPLTAITVVNHILWSTTGGDYGMCSYWAKGSGATGTATVTFSAYTQNAEIQLIEITGDNSATIGVSGTGSGTSSSPSVSLTGLTGGSYEIFFGDAANGTATVPTWTSVTNFTQVGNVQTAPTGTASPSTSAFVSAVYFGSSRTPVSGTLGSSSLWGTIGIEIHP